MFKETLLAVVIASLVLLTRSQTSMSQTQPHVVNLSQILNNLNLSQFFNFSEIFNETFVLEPGKPVIIQKTFTFTLPPQTAVPVLSTVPPPTTVPPATIVKRPGSVELEIVNKENLTILLAIQSVEGDLPEKGFVLEPGKSKTVTVPPEWFGYIWARTHCDLTSYQCLTGHCPSGLDCTSDYGNEPHSYVIFRNTNNFVRYGTSATRGYNIPLKIEPKEGTFSSGGDEYNCKPTECTLIKDECLQDYKVYHENTVIGCRTPCKVYNTDDFCCRGRYAPKQICQSVALPEEYERFLFNSCPTIDYQYYENAKFSCTATAFLISFGDFAA